MASWLQKHRKADLVQLADEAGMQGTAETMRKDDIMRALERHLQANASTLSKEPLFRDYFSRVRSPIKKESEGVVDSMMALAESVSGRVMGTGSKPHARRVSKMSPSSDADHGTSPETPSNILARAPQFAQEVAASIPRAPAALQDIASSLALTMPPSPAAVTDLVERHTDLATQQLRQYYYSFDIPAHLSAVRENLSSVLAVETAFLVLEAWGLQRTTLPWRYAFSLPASAVSGGKPVPMFFPDFFVLLTAAFWGPTMLWVATSLLLPMIVGWLVNFNLVFGRGRQGGYEVDPLVFNITKVLVTWLVYSEGVRFGGLISTSTVNVVQGAVLGGWRGIVIGAFVTAVMTLYEAVLRR